MIPQSVRSMPIPTLLDYNQMPWAETLSAVLEFAVLGYCQKVRRYLTHNEEPEPSNDDEDAPQSKTTQNPKRKNPSFKDDKALGKTNSPQGPQKRHSPSPSVSGGSTEPPRRSSRLQNKEPANSPLANTVDDGDDSNERMPLRMSS